MKKLFIIIGVVIVSPLLVHGETVHLNDGSVIKGSIKSQTEDSINLETSSGNLEIQKSEIKRVDYGIRQNPIPIKEEIQESGQYKSAQPSTKEKISSELILKAGYDFEGDHEVSNAMACAIGYGCISFPDGSEKTKSGYSFSIEAFNFLSENIGVGVGITYQTPRRQKNFEGDFYFIPVYGAIKIRTKPDPSNTYFYLLGQLGYNGFYGDTNYKGSGTLTGGMYSGIGGGVSFGRLVIELLYTLNQGSYDISGYIPGTNIYGNADMDIDYSKTTLNIGYRWGGN